LENERKNRNELRLFSVTGGREAL